MPVSKTLEELESDYWDDPDFCSSLVVTCHELRKVPITELSSENLRLLIVQKIGLLYLLPLAIEKLEFNLLESGDMYYGDLLNAVASVDDVFWVKNPELNNRIVEVKITAEQLAETLNKVLPLLRNREYL